MSPAEKEKVAGTTLGWILLPCPPAIFDRPCRGSRETGRVDPEPQGWDARRGRGTCWRLGTLQPPGTPPRVPATYSRGRVYPSSPRLWDSERLSPGCRDPREGAHSRRLFPPPPRLPTRSLVLFAIQLQEGGSAASKTGWRTKETSRRKASSATLGTELNTINSSSGLLLLGELSPASNLHPKSFGWHRCLWAYSRLSMQISPS